MTPERWQQVKSLLEEVLEQEPENRVLFLSQSCGEDKELYQEVEALIIAESEVEDFLEVSTSQKTNSQTNTLKYKSDSLLQRGLGGGEQFLDKYQILQLIGKGGMGLVYQARHIDLDKFFAIKILNAHSVQEADAIERFKREAKTMARLEHPNVVRVFDYGVSGSTCYLIMEYLEGESLRSRLKKNNQMSIAEIEAFVKEVCVVLEHIHQKGIIHRDLKPDNIFFHKDGEKEILKLLDFGIAKLSSITSKGDSLTITGSVFGTPQYMSPEQCQAKQLDARSDIYSLGLIIYEMLSGSKPFDADTPLSFMYAHVHTPPKDLAEFVPNISRSIKKAVMYALVKDREKRCQNAKEFAQAFAGEINIPSLNNQAIEGVEDASQIATMQHIESFSKTSRNILMIATLLVLIFGFIGLRAKLGLSEKPLVQSLSTPSSTMLVKKEATLPLTLQGKFVFIKGGEVSIGANEGPCPGIEDCKISLDETPLHKVLIRDYYLGIYEITNQEYYEFIEATEYKPPVYWKKGMYPKGAETLPVVNISWDDANAYCKWRAERDKVEIRLPTEFEWEHAARGDDLRLFSWGDYWKEGFANVDGVKGYISPINDAPNNTTDCSPYKIFALMGNVSEWTSSDAEPYVGGKMEDNYFGCKIIRGAGYNTNLKDVRTTCRSWNLPKEKAPNVGFRIAITVKP